MSFIRLRSARSRARGTGQRGDPCPPGPSPFVLLTAAARRLPADQQTDLYEQAWFPELHHILRGDQAMPITRLVHGIRYAAGLWLAAPLISRELGAGSEQQELAFAGLNSRLNLLALQPVEFEHLVRELFDKVGLKSWTTVTSRDAGVDGVIIDDNPITGGMCVVQAKRYSRVVGLEAVHALAGVMQDMHAAQGVLVTTSWVGKASREFVARHGRIEIIEGRDLQLLLQEHLGLDVEINLPQPPSGREHGDIA